MNGFSLFLWWGILWRVVSTPASYSGGFGFKSRPGGWRFLLRIFVLFFSSGKQIPGLYLQLGHNRFLPYPFQSTRWFKKPCEPVRTQIYLSLWTYTAKTWHNWSKDGSGRGHTVTWHTHTHKSHAPPRTCVLRDFWITSHFKHFFYGCPGTFESPCIINHSITRCSAVWATASIVK
jgi:hypothetical protein